MLKPLNLCVTPKLTLPRTASTLNQGWVCGCVCVVCFAGPNHWLPSACMPAGLGFRVFLRALSGMDFVGFNAVYEGFWLQGPVALWIYGYSPGIAV